MRSNNVSTNGHLFVILSCIFTILASLSVTYAHRMSEDEEVEDPRLAPSGGSIQEEVGSLDQEEYSWPLQETDITSTTEDTSSRVNHAIENKVGVSILLY